MAATSREASVTSCPDKSRFGVGALCALHVSTQVGKLGGTETFYQCYASF